MASEDATSSSAGDEDYRTSDMEEDESCEDSEGDIDLVVDLEGIERGVRKHCKSPGEAEKVLAFFRAEAAAIKLVGDLADKRVSECASGAEAIGEQRAEFASDAWLHVAEHLSDYVSWLNSHAEDE